MQIDLATAWEEVADLFPNRNAINCDGRSLDWREFESRASQLATLLTTNGLGKNSKVGLYLHNCNEYVEATFAAFKIEASPVNLNYRYKSDDLVYLLDNADVEAIFFQSCYAMRIWEIRDRLPKIKLFVQVDDGTEGLLKGATDYERALRSLEPAVRTQRDFSSNYLFYTAGTTGLPKGVVHEVGAFSSYFLGQVALRYGREAPTQIEDYRALLTEINGSVVALPACPLIHETGSWLGCFLPMLSGGSIVMSSSRGFNPDVCLNLVEQYRVTDLVFIGDAFAKPILESLDFALKRDDPYDLSSLTQIVSSGVTWSPDVKRSLLSHCDVIMTDNVIAVEGVLGSSTSTRETLGSNLDLAKFNLVEGAVLLSESGEVLGSDEGVVGRVATDTLVPIRYWKDQEKSEKTFLEIAGVSLSASGDHVSVSDDGSFFLLGRDEVSINIANERVFPGEIEEVIKGYKGVVDCTVVGISDGEDLEKIVALIAYEEELSIDESTIQEFVKGQLASIKVPDRMLRVVEVRRSPAGNGDYRWAKETAMKQIQQ